MYALFLKTLCPRYVVRIIADYLGQIESQGESKHHFLYAVATGIDTFWTLLERGDQPHQTYFGGQVFDLILSERRHYGPGKHNDLSLMTTATDSGDFVHVRDMATLVEMPRRLKTTEEFAEMSPERRRCLYKHERRLDYFPSYTQVTGEATTSLLASGYDYITVL